MSFAIYHLRCSLGGIRKITIQAYLHFDFSLLFFWRSDIRQIPSLSCAFQAPLHLLNVSGEQFQLLAAELAAALVRL